jgi:hypothetical protein
MCIPVCAKKRLGRNISVAANTYAKMEYCCTRRFLCCPCSIKENRTSVLPRVSCCLRIHKVLQLFALVLSNKTVAAGRVT